MGRQADRRGEIAALTTRLFLDLVVFEMTLGAIDIRAVFEHLIGREAATVIVIIFGGHVREGRAVGRTGRSRAVRDESEGLDRRRIAAVGEALCGGLHRRGGDDGERGGLGSSMVVMGMKECGSDEFALLREGAHVVVDGS